MCGVRCLPLTDFFFVKDTATTEIYTYGHTLSLPDALPILGGDGNDVLFAGRAANTGFAATDQAATDAALAVDGGNGNYLDGGAGDDRLYGSTGEDWLKGGEGVDLIHGGAGGASLEGGAGHAQRAGGRAGAGRRAAGGGK